MKATKTGLVQSAVYREHITGRGHPERPERLESVAKSLEESGLASKCVPIAPRPAREEEILLCHTASYLKTAKRDVAAGLPVLSTGDTNVCPESLRVALLAAGGVVAAVESVVKGEVGNAFCAVRPPGHHATPDRGMGFCLFNNIAIGARYAQKVLGIGKVLIADWDVHHGNGTQDVFYADGSVFVFNTHQSPLYPGTGAPEETGSGRGLGCIMNCPFPAGAGRSEIVGAFQERLVKAAAAFKPELVMISAGFDSREGDPLGGFKLTDADFAELTLVMKTIAKEHAGGRLVSVLEGGYSLRGLGLGVASHVKALLEPMV